MPSTPSSAFYAHLVITAVVQLVVTVVALATGSVAHWVAAVLVSCSLTLAAHGYTAIRPGAHPPGNAE